MLWIDQQLVQSIHRDFKYISLIIWASAMLWSSTWPRNSEGRAVMLGLFWSLRELKQITSILSASIKKIVSVLLKRKNIDWVFYVKMWRYAQIENLSTSNYDGTLRKTHKSKLFQHLESSVVSCVAISENCPQIVWWHGLATKITKNIKKIWWHIRLYI